MLKAYVDETYNNNVYAIGGFLLTDEQANDITRVWTAEFATYPRVTNFHMQPAQDVNDLLWDWGEMAHMGIQERIALRDQKFAALAGLLAQTKPTGVFVSINQDDYANLYRDKVPQDRNSQYFVLFFTLVLGTTKYFEKSGKLEPIQFVFDDQKQFKKVVNRFYSQALREFQRQEHPAAKIMTQAPQFADDNVVIPLKAADMLMWLIQRQKANRITDDSTTRLYNQFVDMSGLGKHVDQNLLAGILRAVNNGA